MGIVEFCCTIISLWGTYSAPGGNNNSGNNFNQNFEGMTTPHQYYNVMFII